MKSMVMILFSGLIALLLSSCTAMPRAVTFTKILEIPPANQSATTEAGLNSDHTTPALTGESSPPNFSQEQIPGQLGDPVHEPSQTEGGQTGPSIVEEVEEPEETDGEGEITYDVPIIQNESVEAHIEYFQTEIRDRFELWLSRSGRYIPLMTEIFKSYGLPEDLVFVALIESGFNPAAYSRARAVGPWQFIKGTGRRYGLRIDEWIDERRDPIKSTIAAAKYLQDLYSRFSSWPLALASYNAGEGRVMRAMARTKSEDFWDLRSSRYLRRETKNYVPKFMAATIIAKNPEKYGFKYELWEPLQFDEVVIESPTDLRVIARTAEVTYEDLKSLNPELKSTITPLNYKDYVLKLPYGTKPTFLKNFSEVPPQERMIQLRHRVRGGETLSSLARRYGTSVQAIRELNYLGRSHIIHKGQYLLIPMSSKAAAIQEGKKFSKSSGFPESETEPRLKKIVYKVRWGDSLWRISRVFNVPVSQIRNWNGMDHSSILRAGNRLVLYINAEES